jgi:hypothetical protein
MESTAQNAKNSTQHPLDTVRGIARIMDDVVKVPGTRISIGLDPILNLIPFLGDAAGTAMSTFLLVSAVRMNVPKRVIARMLLNISIDALIGAIPALGQIFDFFWKANRKNVELLEQYAATPDKITAQSGTFVGGTLVFVLVLLCIILGVALYLTFTVFSWLTSWLQTI